MEFIAPKSKRESKEKRSPFISAGRNPKSFFFQPKLTIGPVDDPYEREADAVADQVMRMSDHDAGKIHPKISPLSVQRKCAECEEEEQLQKKHNGKRSTEHEAPSIVKDAINSSGNSLDPVTKASMENRFGYDFSDVKIHTDDVAAKSAQSINALAYTSGSDIVFNKGQYSPDTETGQRLLAHELTHVVQQGSGQTDIVQGSGWTNPWETEWAPWEEFPWNAEETWDPWSPWSSENTNPSDAWSGDLIQAMITEADHAKCIGQASRKGIEKMSKCGAMSPRCNQTADFIFRVFFHYDDPLAPRPRPFLDAILKIDLDFTPIGSLSPTFSNHTIGMGTYNGPGFPLDTPLQTMFTLSTPVSGTLKVFLAITDSDMRTNTTTHVEYKDTIPCFVTPCF